MSPYLMLSPAWLMPHPHPRSPSHRDGLGRKGKWMRAGPTPSGRSSRAGSGLTSETLVPPAPGSSTQAPDSCPLLEPHIQIRAPPKAPEPPRAPHLLQLNPQGGPRLRAARGWVSETGSTPLPGPVAPTAPGLTPQQEVAAGEEQQRDALGQGAEEATDPAAHNEDEAQGQDHQDGSVQRCRERGFRTEAGTQTGPPREGQQSMSEPCAPGRPPS